MRIHLIGACGAAMGTLAALLVKQGHQVSGSDEHVYPPMSDFLRSEGIHLLEGYREAHITDGLDLVVIGNAISRGNAELETVLDRGLRYTSLPEAIRDFFLWKADSIVIAGTHGKTTTTSVAGWLLTHGGADPTVLVGGIARNFGDGGASYRVGQGKAFVIEGDEYDSAYFDKTAKFLKYLPDIAVIGNIEFDHADIYANLDEIRVAFRRLVNLVPRRGLTLIGMDSPDAAALAPLARSRVQTFGTSEGAEWRAVEIAYGPQRHRGTETTGPQRHRGTETTEPQRHGDTETKGPQRHRDTEKTLKQGSVTDGATTGAPAAQTCFRLLRSEEDLGLFTLPLVGEHNVRNALAALAVGVEVGIPIDTLREGLTRFLGVKRRLEVVGTRRGVTVYDDFAHHPTAVAETLLAIREAVPGHRVWAIFEPRSASSCRRVFQADFARAFEGADQVVIASVFRSSLPESERLSEAELVRDLERAGVLARHVPTVDAIVAAVTAEAREGDLVVIMSNGGFDGIHRKLIEAL
jgi:UDP-N-acetylmuramate: L-alanyl-gamma-D-glutamyl-meso-diaminopimelate ligase